MKSVFVVTLTFLFFVNLYSQEKTFPQPRIEFNPPVYVCCKTDIPIVVDGKLDEKMWGDTEWTDYFVDIEGALKPLPRFKTRAKMLWDNKYFYIAAEMEEPDLWATLRQRDTIIFYDNDFEVFIDPDGDTHKYYEIEFNAYKTVWDLLLIKPYRDANKREQIVFNSWDINGLQLGVHLNGTINNPGDRDTGWTFEMAIPWTALRESYSNTGAPKDGEQWRINFSRVEWKLKTSGDNYKKEINPSTGKPYPEDNWVWAPTGLINIHYPEMWGYVQFSNAVSGREKIEFEKKEFENAKWVMRKLYYSEKTFYMNNQAYTNDVSKLDMLDMIVDGYIWPPKIEATTNFFEAVLVSSDGKEIISIKNDGEVRVNK
ncbi:MAG: carbohydrate-binding family 9-like protein [Ignavibacteriae bacterium HGW-Ignavibacteriae-3]|nr:MAG: carbohydrate-binding family 9-like protein [Ignavibacteriae bacterium HGW-Ignavibacteriae-3]